MKRGDKVRSKDGLEGVILGREDFAGYDRNLPSGAWELVDFKEYGRWWSPTWTLEVIE